MLYKITATKWLLSIACLYIILFTAHAAMLGKSVYGDGIFYYSWMRSIIVDKDINFTNELAHFNVSQPFIQIGIPGNKYAIGFPLILSPWVALAHVLIRGDGYGFLYQFVTGLVSVLHVLIGVLLIYKTLRLYFLKLPSILAVLSLALATNLLFYGSIDPVNSHSISFFLAALLVCVLLSSQKTGFISGLIAGLLTSTRAQDALLVLLLVPFLTKKSFLYALIGCVFGFLPQIIIWFTLYGSIINPYLSNGEGFSLTLSRIPSVFFSPNNGLFLWTPVAIMGLAGLSFPSKVSKFFRITSSILFFLEALLIANWSTWWQGASFSGRMFVSMLPILTIGMAALYDKLQMRMKRMGLFLFMIPLGFGFVNSILIVYRLLLN